MAKYVETYVEKLVLQFLEGTDIELVDVEYVKEHDWYLRVFIDKTGGIDIEDCQSLSEKLEDVLDREDKIQESYILEVSSPGLDRALKKPRDFEREHGKMVDVTLYTPVNGTKLLTGKIMGYHDGILTIDAQDIDLKQIALVRLHIDF